MAAALASVAPHQAATAWEADPLAVVALLALGWAYARGLQRLRRRAGGTAPLARWRPRAFAGGMLALAVALISPLHVAGETLLSAHMIQHLLLMTAAPPLLIAGRPVLVCSWAVSDRRREAAHRALRGLRRRTWRSGPVAAAITAGYLAVLWAWHLPPVYEAALESWVLHGLEHTTMLGVACLLWWAVLRRGVSRYGAGVLAMALTGAGGGALAALLTFSARSWYRPYDPAAAGWPLTALDDQQLAGAVLWVVGGLAHAAAAAVLFAWWLRALERRRPPVARSPVSPEQEG